MFKRYDLNVYNLNGSCIYSNSFSSINLLAKFACGFDKSLVELEGLDIITEKTLPMEEICNVFRGECYGI